MSNILAKIKRGGESLPPRILLSGPEGIGKSTFGASAPSPLFISQEQGLTGLDHVARITPESFKDTLDVVDALTADPGEYKSLVIDTTDWLERSIHAYVCKRDGQPNIEGYGFGKGYKVAELEMNNLLAKLDTLRERQKICIILLSHVQIKTFTSPTGDQWDRYEMKGHKGITGMLREWPDACLFAVYEVFRTKGAGGKEKTIGGGRIIQTCWSPGWDAKNRLSLPETLELSWEAFSEAVEANRPDKLRDTFNTLLKTAKLTPEQRKVWEKTPVNTLPADRIKLGISKLETLQ